MDKLIDAARFEPDPQKYNEEVERFITLAFEDVPRIPLFQPIARCRDAEEHYRAIATGSIASSITANW